MREQIAKMDRLVLSDLERAPEVRRREGQARGVRREVCEEEQRLIALRLRKLHPGEDALVPVVDAFDRAAHQRGILLPQLIQRAQRLERKIARLCASFEIAREERSFVA